MEKTINYRGFVIVEQEVLIGQKDMEVRAWKIGFAFPKSDTMIDYCYFTEKGDLDYGSFMNFINSGDKSVSSYEEAYKRGISWAKKRIDDILLEQPNTLEEHGVKAMKLNTTNEIKKIRGTLIKILAYVKRGASADLAQYRSPGRWDYFIQSLMSEAGGRTQIPLKYAKRKAIKYGYAWGDDLEEAINIALSIYGLSLSNSKEIELDPYWDSRDNYTLKKVAGKPWDKTK